jgi:LmbE family N-acetylglucosaminyl deacetylase
MERYIRDQQPTMVFVPSIHDTSQHINFNTRRMVLRAVNRWIEDGHNEGKKREVMVVEYPTNHVPILPPSDKNFDVAFTDPNLALLKHEANRAHESQNYRMKYSAPSFSEAIAAMTVADDVEQIKRLGRRFSRRLSGIELDARTSRGEHYGVTLRRVKSVNGKPTIVEERLHFPLKPPYVRKWYKD